MGIYHLNRYLKSKCRKSIREINLRELQGKTIVVDASIYMYKYAGEQRLIEGMYQFISTFLYYNIKPIFIFDGAPPAEKKALLDARNTQKRNAKREYYTIIESLDKDDDDGIKRARYELERLQKRFVRLSKKDYDDVCELIDCFGVQYFRAEKEADELCVKFVIDGKAWACMSEDTDMFVYGCPRVLRYVSFMHFTGVLYDTADILMELNMTYQEFCEICVLSGTDYNYNASRDTSLQKTIQHYNKYIYWKKTNKSGHSQNELYSGHSQSELYSGHSQNELYSGHSQSELYSGHSQSEFYSGHSQSEFYSGHSQSEFYSWLMKNTNYITDYKKLIETLKMFDITTLDYPSEITINNDTKYNKKKLQEFLQKFNFIFMNRVKV